MKTMSYVPYSAGYNPSMRTPAYVAAETARNNARVQAVHQQMVNGNQVMGDLVTECCSDPAYGGQSYYGQSGADAPAAAVPSTVGAASTVPAAVASSPAVSPASSPSSGYAAVPGGPATPAPGSPGSNGGGGVPGSASVWPWTNGSGGDWRSRNGGGGPRSGYGGGGGAVPGGGSPTPGSASDFITALSPSSPTAGANGGDAAALAAALSSYQRTPVDILTGTYGFPVRANGKPWPRPRLSAATQRRQSSAFPNFGPSIGASRLVPPCPCFSSAPPVPIAVPVMATPAPAPVATPVAPAPAAPAASCPYPACSTGNICLDLVTGCVLNSQITSDQQLACALANYGTFGNMGVFLSDVIHGCQPPPYLGSPNLSPPPADPSMRALITAAIAKKSGVSGLGQADDSSGVGGILAIVAVAGILVWANKKW